VAVVRLQTGRMVLGEEIKGRTPRKGEESLIHTPAVRRHRAQPGTMYRLIYSPGLNARWRAS